VAPLSAFAIGPLARGGLVLGYTEFTPAALKVAVRRLGTVLVL
jgi:hypothetical protein